MNQIGLGENMKFKIFISSNRHEFYNERKIIKESIESDIILNRFFKVFAFEEEPASGKTPEQTYSEAVLESDIYIGLIGSKYGTILESGISPTETEYNLFNADENTYFFLKEAYEREEKTLEFIKRIENKHTYKTFNNQEELIIEIKRSLSDFLDNNMNNTKRNFDKKIIKNSTIEELDEEAYEIFFNMMRDNALKNLKDERTKEEILALINAGELINGKFHFNNAGAICFCKNLSKFDIEHEVKMVRFRSDTRLDIIDKKECCENIFKLLDEVRIFFSRNTREGVVVRGFDGLPLVEYPFDAVREAIINAIAHRDYSIDTSPITFYIYRNRIEIISPGKLMPPVNIENLGQGNPSHRNKNICHILAKTHYMEHVGTGIKRMKDIMLEEGLKEPEFVEMGEFFQVILWGRDKDSDTANLGKKLMEAIKNEKFNQRQKKALLYLYNKGKSITIKDYYQHFNISRQSASRELNELSKEKLIVKRNEKRTNYFKINSQLKEK